METKKTRKKECYTDTIKCENSSNTIEGTREIIYDALKQLTALEDDGKLIYKLDIKVKFRQKNVTEDSKEEIVASGTKVQDVLNQFTPGIMSEFIEFLESRCFPNTSGYMSQSKFDTFALLFSGYYRMLYSEKLPLNFHENCNYLEFNKILKNIDISYRIKCVRCEYQNNYRVIKEVKRPLLYR